MDDARGRTRSMVSAARKMLREREAEEESARRALLAAAREDFDRTVELIVQKYRPREVWQWGSLLYPDTFTSGSDIDIGLVGVSVTDHMEIQRLTEGTACLPLHIARLEEMDPRNVAHLKKYGKRVYPDTA